MALGPCRFQFRGSRHLADGRWQLARCSAPPVFLCHKSTSFARLEQANLVGVELSELSGATSGAPCLTSRCSQTLYNRLLGFWVRAFGFRGHGLVVVALCDAVAGRMQPAVCETREMHSRKNWPSSLFCFSFCSPNIYAHRTLVRYHQKSLPRYLPWTSGLYYSARLLIVDGLCHNSTPSGATVQCCHGLNCTGSEQTRPRYLRHRQGENVPLQTRYPRPAIRCSAHSEPTTE